MKNKFWGLVAIVLLVISLLPACSTGEVRAPSNIHPVIFVHGFAGSGAQFESQAMRFESNGYPANYIYVYEYDTSAGLSPQFPPSELLDDIERFISSVLKDTGADKVDVLGHSLGTKVMQTYLNSSPERAAKVAHYVNIDGMPSTELPGGVPTLALWADRNPPGFPVGGEVVGATNITISNVTHVECATCPQSFVEIYKFLTGKSPVTDKVVAEPSGNIELAGRAVIFPQNTGVQDTGATLEVWEVDGQTGARKGSQPQATYPIGGNGDWGPFQGKTGVNYEFALVREPLTVHFYYEPFLRSDYLIRLNNEIPGKGMGSHMDAADGHSDLYISRSNEFWGDQGADSDVLTIDGTNICTAQICPITHLVNAIFVYDKDSDGKSDLTQPVQYFYTVIPVFLSGADLYIPADSPPTETISLVLTPRGSGGLTQVINVPNWPSTKDRIAIQFNDFVQAK
jgi:pimeloyl-ACP methyl ester carboxylesterase